MMTICPKKAINVFNVVRKKPLEKRKKGMALYKMKTKSSLTPSMAISYFSCQVGSPIPPIMTSREVLERNPRDRKLRTGI
jgi:hypothetical protein